LRAVKRKDWCRSNPKAKQNTKNQKIQIVLPHRRLKSFNNHRQNVALVLGRRGLADQGREKREDKGRDRNVKRNHKRIDGQRRSMLPKPKWTGSRTGSTRNQWLIWSE